MSDPSLSIIYLHVNIGSLKMNATPSYINETYLSPQYIYEMIRNSRKKENEIENVNEQPYLY